MSIPRITIGISLMLVMGLSACSRDRDPNLMRLRSATPDEFAILPTKPLEMPRSFAELPEPAPSGTNRADRRPEDEAIAALGGRPERVNQPGIPAGDAGLVAAAGRYGVNPTIRATLAEEDRDIRRRQGGRLLERLFGVNTYYRTYRPQAVPAYDELDRFRAAGRRTPAAPPEPER